MGDEFAAEVLNAINRIVTHPEAWTELSKRTRRCRTNRFPYSIIYQIRDDRILVVAVAHSKMKASEASEKRQGQIFTFDVRRRID